MTAELEEGLLILLGSRGHTAGCDETLREKTEKSARSCS